MTTATLIPPFRVLMHDPEAYRLTLLPTDALLSAYEAGVASDPRTPRHRKVAGELGGRLQRQGPCRSFRWAYSWSWDEDGIVRAPVRKGWRR